MIPVDEPIQGRPCLCLQTASCLLSLPPTPPNLYSQGREALIEDNSPDMRQYICFGLRVGLSLLLEGGLPSAAPRDQGHSTMAVATHLPHRVFETVGLWLVVHGRPPGPVRVWPLCELTFQVCGDMFRSICISLSSQCCVIVYTSSHRKRAITQ